MRTILGLAAAHLAALVAPLVAAQTIVPISGNGAVAPAGSSTPGIVLEVRGASGAPIPGVTVTFDQHCTYRNRNDTPPYACVSGPSPSPTVVSDSAGRLTTPPYVSDGGPGNAWVRATAIVEARLVEIHVYWTVNTGPLNPARLISGNNQTVQVGFPAEPLTARIVDDFGRPMPGVAVVFPSNCASLPCLQAPTGATRLVSDPSGFVDSGVRIANNVTGSHDILMSIAGAAGGLTFSINNVPAFRTATARMQSGFEAFFRMTNAPTTCSFTRVQRIEDSLLARPPFMLAVPEDPIEISIDNCPVGASVALSLQHPGGFPEGAKIWLARPSWQTLGSTAFIEGFWEFALVDGGAGDADGVANGKISTVLALGFGDPVNPNYQDLWWAGQEENGWGMSIVQHRDVLFVVIFAYDSAGQPTWYVMSSGTWNAARDTYTGVIYSPRGRPLNEHVAANLVLGAPVGSLSLIFADSMNLRAVVTFGASTNTPSIKFMERQLFGPRDSKVIGRMDDMWWAGVTRNGWGLAIHQQYTSLFSVLFTYGTDGKPVWYPMPAGTWTGTGNTVYEGHVYRPSGPSWPADYNPALFVAATVGSFKLDFANGAATFDFTAEGRRSNFPIQRMGF